MDLEFWIEFHFKSIAEVDLIMWLLTTYNTQSIHAQYPLNITQVQCSNRFLPLTDISIRNSDAIEHWTESSVCLDALKNFLMTFDWLYLFYTKTIQKLLTKKREKKMRSSNSTKRREKKKQQTFAPNKEKKNWKKLNLNGKGTGKTYIWHVIQADWKQFRLRHWSHCTNNFQLNAVLRVVTPGSDLIESLVHLHYALKSHPVGKKEEKKNKLLYYQSLLLESHCNRN